MLLASPGLTSRLAVEEMLMKGQRSKSRVQDDDPEDQGSEQAKTKIEAKRSKRALKE